jgi:asparagine synthase (glutamine-hydrolysing)
MCGIAGIVSKVKVDNLSMRIEKMTNSLFHRGPDAQKTKFLNDFIAFGHTRLSIIDLSENANQPMTSNSGQFTIVFNGEIMNYREIKNELSYNFKNNSDTEVILAAVEEKGIDWFLKRANGMFAFSIYDHVNELLYLVKDRFGIKPLFYMKDKNKIIFASEIKSILSSGLVDANFFEIAIDEYLANRFIREPYTFFEDIYQLESSHYMIIDKDINVKKIKYWELPRLNFSNIYNEKSILEKTEEELVSAIKRWLVSDVQVGSYLSGGVDSSFITAVMSKESNHPVRTYTIGFNDDEYNEFKYARLVSYRYKTIHSEIELPFEDYVAEWKRLIWFKDAPIAVPNEIPLSIMTTKLSKDVKVVMSGEGADELLAGYGRIFRLPFDYENHFCNKSFYEEFVSKYEYVGRDFRDKYLNSSKDLRIFFDEKVSTDFKNYSNEENIFRFFHNSHIKGLLQRVDTTTMQASVEARPPFLDHELIEYSYREIPYDLKLKWLNNEFKEKAKSMMAEEYSEKFDIPKYILKKISYKYLPEKVIERRKMGFPVPLNLWLNDLNLLAKEHLNKASWFKSEYLDELLTDLSSNNKIGQTIWMLVNVEIFRKQYFEKDWRY